MRIESRIFSKLRIKYIAWAISPKNRTNRPVGDADRLCCDTYSVELLMPVQ